MKVDISQAKCSYHSHGSYVMIYSC